MDYTIEFQNQIANKSKTMLDQIKALVDKLAQSMLFDFQNEVLKSLYTMQLPCANTYTQQELTDIIDQQFAIAKITNYVINIVILPVSNCTYIEIKANIP